MNWTLECKNLYITFARMYFSFTVKESSGDGFEIEARDNVDSFSLQKKHTHTILYIISYMYESWNKTLIGI